MSSLWDELAGEMLTGLQHIDEDAEISREYFEKVLRLLLAGKVRMHADELDDSIVWLYGRILQTFILSEDYETGADYFMETYDDVIADDMKNRPGFWMVEKAFMEIADRVTY